MHDQDLITDLHERCMRHVIVHGCMGGWVHGCMGAWVRGWMGAWVDGCAGLHRSCTPAGIVVAARSL